MPSYNYYLKCTAATSAYTNGSDHVLAGSDWVQFYPGIGRDASIQYDIENFRHRRIFDGSLTFVNNQVQSDYTYISQIESTSAEVLVRVEQVCGITTSSDWWEGYFSIIDGEWDSDRAMFVVKPAPEDDYKPIEEQGDKIFNLITDVGGNTLAAKYALPFTTYEISNPTCISDGWQTFQDDNPTFPATEHTPGDTWDNWAVCESCNSTGSQPPSDVPFDPSGTCSECADDGGGIATSWKYTWYKQVSPVKITSSWVWDNTEQAYALGSCTAPTATYSFNARGFNLNDIINTILGDLDGTLTYKSTFFNNDDFPNGDPGGTENYVTGVDPNPLNQILFYQKSDTKTTSDPATKAEISFNELMDILTNMFNVYWFIQDGEFRIEHYSNFSKSVDVDLTAAAYSKWINATNKWSYDIQDMPNREHFEWMEAEDVDFIGRDIIYDRVATGNRYKDNQKDRILSVTTDAAYLYGKPEDISNEGWAMFQTSGSDYLVGNIAGAKSGVVKINGNFSWANLHEDYWTYGRVIQSGNMNGVDVTFDSWQKNIKQIGIQYPDCCVAFDPDGLKTTNLGDGEVREASYKMIDGMIDTVFFYLDVTVPDPPPGSTYYIKYSNTGITLTGSTDKLIFYG
jgi:hypothetical protein